METISVDVRRKASRDSADVLEADLQTARLLANLLDAEFQIAGIPFWARSDAGHDPRNR
jgi:hypothetical protein